MILKHRLIHCSVAFVYDSVF